MAELEALRGRLEEALGNMRVRGGGGGGGGRGGGAGRGQAALIASVLHANK